MFLIREAGPADFRGVFALARRLDSYNLPADPAFIRELLRTSRLSFRGSLPKSRARYLFVLEDLKPVPGTGETVPGTGKVVGCSLIIAKHGTPGRPHLWLGLETVTKRSRTLGLRRSQRVLRLGYTEDGPTEVGGLVVLPRYRKRPESCGLQVSFVRFLYMAVHPERFERDVLVEYRGAMGAGNQSPFWDAVGRLFTGLDYQRADRLSVTNKEFILNLFPREPIYCALLPAPLQRAIGAIHPAARRAAALLSSIGFRPLPQIEPFDGGPYFSARRARIRLVRGTRRMPAAAGPRPGGAWTLVGTERGGRFRAALVQADWSGGRCRIAPEWMRMLKIHDGEPVYACRLPR